MRTTLGQVMQSRLPQTIGKCANDVPHVAAYVNEAQQRLINAGGETGWWGGWQKVVFNVSRCQPYITLPREFARIVNMAYCRMPVRIQNEFYELLEASIGLQDFCRLTNWCGAVEGYERGVFPTMRDIDPTNQLLRVYITDPRDVGRSIIIGPAKDQNGNFIYGQTGINSVNGFSMTFAQPFTDSGFIVTSIDGIYKDATFGDVLLYQVDATTGAQVLLSRYAPDEITPAYRRYFLGRLPCGCLTHSVPQSPCVAGVQTPGVVQVTAIAKLEWIPANRTTDFLIVGNIPALIEEVRSIRYSDMDSADAPAFEAKSHLKAIKLLNDEIRHYLGELQPAVNVAPFGTAKLRRVMRAVATG